ncbi:hypothetical protein FACS1894186_6150 [Alphaproteobacteria bacterium]|nr:hypothetical protein FACS1894186_6150 [Alphaproteobacteria bacterium]
MTMAANILAIETSLGAASAAVARDGKVVAEARGGAAFRTAEELPALLESVMKAAGLAWADLGMIAATVGPGSFTGIRTGLATARGLALALNIPARGYLTFDVARWSAGLEPSVPIALSNWKGGYYASDGLRIAEDDELAAGTHIAAAAEIDAGGLARLAASGAAFLLPEPVYIAQPSVSVKCA